MIKQVRRTEKDKNDSKQGERNDVEEENMRGRRRSKGQRMQSC